MLLEPMYEHRRRAFLRVLFGLMAVSVLLIQAIHPGMHPDEVFGPSTPPHLGCPINHAVADLPQALPLLLFTSLASALWSAPRLWSGHLPFKHALAPRPPPNSHR